MSKETMKAELVFHFSTDDTGCEGDYYDLELFIDGKLIRNFGDYYHNKADEKARGFIEGIEWVTGEKVEIKDRCIADRDD